MSNKRPIFTCKRAYLRKSFLDVHNVLRNPREYRKAKIEISHAGYRTEFTFLSIVNKVIAIKTGQILKFEKKTHFQTSQSSLNSIFLFNKHCIP